MRAAPRVSLPRAGGHQLGQRRVRAVAVGQDRAAVGRRGDRRPRHADGRVVPGEARARRGRRTRSSRGRAARAARGRGSRGRRRPGSRPSRRRASSRVSTTGAARVPASTGRTSTSATNARPAADDPVVELAAVVVQAAQDAGGRGREVRLDEAGLGARRRAGVGRGQGRGTPRRATARGTTPRLSPWRGDRAVADAGQRPTAARVERSSRPTRRAGRALAEQRRQRSRPAPPATAGAARRPAAASARARAHAGGVDAAARSTPGPPRSRRRRRA